MINGLMNHSGGLVGLFCCNNVMINVIICRLFDDDSEESIQFLADSDEQQDDKAVVSRASVCISADFRSKNS